MKSYSETFAELNRAALIPFFVIGDPDIETGYDVVKKAVDSGADILELGIPFSDPIADGTTIQKADIRSVNAGMTVDKARKFIAKVKEYKDIPIGLLMYYNLVYQYGIEKFFRDFHTAGANSILIADMNIDDSEEVTAAANKAGVDTVFMVTPNTEAERMQRIASACSGFIYTVSVLGVTGSRNKLSDTVAELVAGLKKITDVPVCVGFGISSPQQAAVIASAGADGVIIGSHIVQMIEDNLDDKAKMLSEIGEFIEKVRDSLDDQA